MSALIPIPVKAYAIAAAEAAFLHSESVADIFDDERHSRARFVALLALSRFYPAARKTHLAQNLGFSCDCDSLASRTESARCSNWWRDADVVHVLGALRRSFSLPPLEDDFDETDHAPRAPHIEARAAVFEPRKYRPARILTIAPRIPNMTAHLMGDPPAGRREYLSTLQSPFYAGGRESRR